MVSSNRESRRRVEAETKLVFQFKLLVGLHSIYIVCDTNLQINFYVASDIFKNNFEAESIFRYNSFYPNSFVRIYNL